MTMALRATSSHALLVISLALSFSASSQLEHSRTAQSKDSGRSRPALPRQPSQLIAAPRPSSSPSKRAVNKDVLALLVGTGALTAAGSLTILVFASLVRLPIPARSLAAACTIAVASAILEARIGYERRGTYVGRTISEVGQALAIAAAGWATFSAAWYGGFGSVLAPGRVPILNLGAVCGCVLAAATYGRVRPVSRSMTAVPFASALVMLHLHLLVNPEANVPKQALMALASAPLVLAALAIDAWVHRVGSGVRGTEDMVLAALAVNLGWSFLTLGQWTFAEAPTWGFVAVAAALASVQFALRAAFAELPPALQASRRYYVGWVEASYTRLASWLAVLGAWRTLWPDPPPEAPPGFHFFAGSTEELKRFTGQLRQHKGKRERHFFSLVGAFGLWGWSAAAAGRTGTGAVAMALLLTTLFKTAVASLFGEPLLMAGVLGVVAGGGLLALLVRFAGDDY
jgi:hypothetical protein